MNIRITGIKTDRIGFYISGTLSASTSVELRTVIMEYLNQGVTNFELDISEVIELNSAGIAPIIQLKIEVEQRSGELSLIPPINKSANRILRLTKFYEEFNYATNSHFLV